MQNKLINEEDPYCHQQAEANHLFSPETSRSYGWFHHQETIHPSPIDLPNH